MHQNLSEPEFSGDLPVVYKFKKIVGRADFSDQFGKIIICYKRSGYNINIMRQTATLVVNPITLLPSLIVRRWDGPGIKLFILVGWGRSFFVCCLAHRGSTVDVLLLQCNQWCCLIPQGSPGVGRNTLFLSSLHFCFITVFICDLFVSCDDPLVS